MKIECPECKLSGTIGDDAVPATGMAMNCPRCKAHFVVERPLPGSAEASACMDSCPSCQYATFSEEKFSVCPKCGLVVADYLRQKLSERGTGRSSRKAPAEVAPLTAEQLRRDEESRRKHGLDGEGHSPGDAQSPPATADLPMSLLVVGWGTLLVALGLLAYGGSGFLDYLARLDEAKAALLAGENALSGGSLFGRFALFPLLLIAYAVAMAVLANRFLALQFWAVRALEIGGWTGVALGG